MDGLSTLYGVFIEVLGVDLDDYFFLSFGMCGDQGVNLAIELCQILVHVLFLVFRFLSPFFIGLEVFQIILVGVNQRFRVGDFLGDSMIPLVFITLFNLHEAMSPLQRLPFDILGRLWEEITKVEHRGFADAHENNVGDLLMFRGAMLIDVQGFENDVRLEVVEDVVITKVGILGQEDERFGVAGIIAAFIRVELDHSLSDKIHFLDVALV